MAEVNLEFLANQVGRVLDEMRAIREEQKALRSDLRRNTEIVVGLARTFEHMREDLVSMLKAEISGLFIHLEIQLERRIGEEIDQRLSPRPEQ